MHALFQDIRYALRQMRRLSCIRHYCFAHTGAGHWRQHSSLQRDECRAVARYFLYRIRSSLFYVHMPDGQPSGAFNTGNSTTSFSEPVFEVLRQDKRAFADLIAFVPLSISGKVAVRFGDAAAEEAEGDEVSGNFFSGLRVQMVRGRGFTLDDEKNHEPVAVLSYSYWTRRFFVILNAGTKPLCKGCTVHRHWDYAAGL